MNTPIKYTVAMSFDVISAQQGFPDRVAVHDAGVELLRDLQWRSDEQTWELDGHFKVLAVEPLPPEPEPKPREWTVWATETLTHKVRVNARTAEEAERTAVEMLCAAEHDEYLEEAGGMEVQDVCEDDGE